MPRRHLIAAAVLAALLTACGSDRAESCEDIPAEVLTAIEEGINTGGVSVSNSGAIPFAGGLLVAGTLAGPGLDDEVTGWVVGRLDPPGSIRSADSVAAEFTNWPLERTDLGDAETCLDD